MSILRGAKHLISIHLSGQVLFEALLNRKNSVILIRVDRVLSNFIQGPDEQYVYTSRNNYERLLAHQLAAWYGLQSESPHKACVEVIIKKPANYSFPKARPGMPCAGGLSHSRLMASPEPALAQDIVTMTELASVLVEMSTRGPSAMAGPMVAGMGGMPHGGMDGHAELMAGMAGMMGGSPQLDGLSLESQQALFQAMLHGQGPPGSMGMVPGAMGPNPALMGLAPGVMGGAGAANYANLAAAGMGMAPSNVAQGIPLGAGQGQWTPQLAQQMMAQPAYGMHPQAAAAAAAAMMRGEQGPYGPVNGFGRPGLSPF